jgi:hypothetical protein
LLFRKNPDDGQSPKTQYLCTVLPVLYKCETCSLTVSDEHSFEGFKSRTLWKIFGPNWRNLHEAGENCIMARSFIMSCLPNIISVIKSRNMKCVELQYGWEGREMIVQFWMEMLVGTRPLGRPRHRWESNIKINLKEVGYESMVWILLLQSMTW